MQMVFIAGISVFLKHAHVVLIFFLSVLGAGFFITNIAFKETVNSDKYFFATLSIGGVILVLLAYALMLAGYFFPVILKPGSFFLLVFLVLIALKNLWLQRSFFKRRSFLFGGVFFFLLLLLRLAFLKSLLLPGYSDSPVHYQIIEGFLNPTTETTFRYSFATIFLNYYHFGFHSLAGWLFLVSGISIADAISLLGQFFLVLASVSVSSLVFILSGDIKASFFAALLTAIGWQMPAFAINWGKFPALAALSMFPAVLGYLFLLGQKTNYRKKLAGIFLLLAGLFLLHTRMIFLLSLAVFSYLVVSKMEMEESPEYTKSVLYTVLFFIVLYPLLQPLRYFYAQMPVLILFFVLLPFAFRAYFQHTLVVFLFIGCLWGAGALPSLVKMPVLLNKEMLEIVLYLPLSVVGGMGFSGILKKLSRYSGFQKLIALVFVAVIILSFVQHGAVYPDQCCVYFQGSDALAFEFMQENLPANSLVLISSFKNSAINSGTDAGLWIMPLLKQPTNNFFYDANWSVPDRLAEVCEFGAEHIFIYVGGRAYSFNAARLAHAEWYELVFRSGKTRIYQVESCPR